MCLFPNHTKQCFSAVFQRCNALLNAMLPANNGSRYSFVLYFNCRNHFFHKSGFGALLPKISYHSTSSKRHGELFAQSVVINYTYSVIKGNIFPIFWDFFQTLLLYCITFGLPIFSRIILFLTQKFFTKIQSSRHIFFLLFCKRKKLLEETSLNNFQLGFWPFCLWCLQQENDKRKF